MNSNLDRNLRKWLTDLASNWELPVGQAVLLLGEDEIANRAQNYPKVRAVLTGAFGLQEFAAAVRQCWVLAGRFDAIRLNGFVDNRRRAATAIQQFITDFPKEDQAAAERIDAFLSKAVELGFATPKRTYDWAGAMQLASLILTVLFPNRFVDFRRERWKKYAEKFGYDLPFPQASRGELLLWAGRFAKELCETVTYREYWPPVGHASGSRCGSSPEYVGKAWRPSGHLRIRWIRTDSRSPRAPRSGACT